jgi:hypothetical protein
LTFRKKGYEARTPASATRDTDTSGALEIAGPCHKTLWHNDPDREPRKSKLFFTRGDIFEGIFYKYAMKEGIMHKL